MRRKIEIGLPYPHNRLTIYYNLQIFTLIYLNIVVYICYIWRFQVIFFFNLINLFVMGEMVMLYLSVN